MKPKIKLTVTIENSEGFSESASAEEEYFQDIPSNQLKAAVGGTIQGFKNMMTILRQQAGGTKR